MQDISSLLHLKETINTFQALSVPHAVLNVKYVIINKSQHLFLGVIIFNGEIGGGGGQTLSQYVKIYAGLFVFLYANSTSRSISVELGFLRIKNGHFQYICTQICVIIEKLFQMVVLEYGYI